MRSNTAKTTLISFLDRKNTSRGQSLRFYPSTYQVKVFLSNGFLSVSDYIPKFPKERENWTTWIAVTTWESFYNKIQIEISLPAIAKRLWDIFEVLLSLLSLLLLLQKQFSIQCWQRLCLADITVGKNYPKMSHNSLEFGYKRMLKNETFFGHF